MEATSTAAAAIQFSAIDWLIVVSYLAFALGLGLFFSRTNSDTDNFFLGSRAMPGWALGISLVATAVSSNTFLGM
eukprot:SAG31_NODE_13808_length_845_cov_1.061662_1_plen_74_part_01